MICWEDFNGNDFDILCKTLNSETLQLSDVIVLCNDGSNQKSPDVYATLDGAYLFTWEDSRNSFTSDIFYQEMQNGMNMHDQNGIVLCDADFNQKNPKIDIYNESENSYMIYWDDLRSSGKEDLTNIYIQSVSINCQDCESSCMLGDVSIDGILNVLDIVNLVNLVLELSDNFTPEQICSADLNQDGVTNILDIVLLVGIILGQL